MKSAIAIITIILMQFAMKVQFNEIGPEVLISGKDSATYSLRELKKMYADKGFVLISATDHKYEKKTNSIFVFEKELKAQNVKQNRDLVICEKVKSNRWKIIVVNKNAIYSKLSSIQCDNAADSFVKIAAKKSFITLEQIRCGTNSTITIKEFFTFRLDAIRNKYLLNKYSIIIQQRLGPDDNNHYVLDDYPVETLSESNLEKISLQEFAPELLKPFWQKFPSHIYELY